MEVGKKGRFTEWNQKGQICLTNAILLHTVGELVHSPDWSVSSFSVHMDGIRKREHVVDGGKRRRRAVGSVEP